MAVIHLLTLTICWSLVEVNSQQTFPYVSFMGQTLANHSYVNLSLVGHDRSGSDSVQCHTDLSTCCSNTQGSRRGDWYFPDGTRLPFAGDNYQNRHAQRVDICRINDATTPLGVYRCDIATNAVHDNYQSRESVYIGLYVGNRGISVQTSKYLLK